MHVNMQVLIFNKLNKRSALMKDNSFTHAWT